MEPEAQICLLVLLCAAVVTDLRESKIKNSLILAGIVAAILCRMTGNLQTHWCAGLVGLLLPMVTLSPLLILRTVGAGDIKLFGIVGAFVGIERIFYYMAAGFLFGAVLALYQMLRQRDLNRRIYRLFNYFYQLKQQKTFVPYYQETNSQNGEMHFSIPILFGSIFCMLLYS